MDKFDKLYFLMKNRMVKHYKDIQFLYEREKRTILRNNLVLSNIHNGERCFIVGNGPSLRKQNLALLKDEYVFTVNYFPKSDLYPLVKSNYHVLMDPAIFDFTGTFGEEKKQYLNNIKINGINPICFAQFNAKQSIEQNKIDKDLKFYYIDSGYTLSDGFSAEMNLTKIVPGFSNVVLYAIMIAIFMGFNKIYLIGCDMTGYEQLSSAAGKEVDLHVYRMDEKEKKMIHETHSRIDAESFFEGFYNMFVQYRLMNQIARKRNILIYNATSGGVLDAFERVDYESLFPRERAGIENTYNQ
ncbi:MAG: DUF115 domain-containing protein [Eubacteriales bacterium]|nr:DUF115 domain-containing protein [Eubacteriales bacterium]